MDEITKYKLEIYLDAPSGISENALDANIECLETNIRDYLSVSCLNLLAINKFKLETLWEEINPTKPEINQDEKYKDLLIKLCSILRLWAGNKNQETRKNEIEKFLCELDEASTEYLSSKTVCKNNQALNFAGVLYSLATQDYKILSWNIGMIEIQFNPSEIPIRIGMD